MSEQDVTYIERSITLAETALSNGLAPFGSVILDGQGQLIAEAYNQVASDYDPSAHAEVMAIRRACTTLKTVRLEGCTLYTSCEPCLMCSYLITRTGISRVVYSARSSDVPGRPALLGQGLPEIAAWVNTHSGWSPLEIVGDVLREHTLPLFERYSWA